MEVRALPPTDLAEDGEGRDLGVPQAERLDLRLHPLLLDPLQHLVEQVPRVPGGRREPGIKDAGGVRADHEVPAAMVAETHVRAMDLLGDDDLFAGEDLVPDAEVAVEAGVARPVGVLDDTRGVVHDLLDVGGTHPGGDVRARSIGHLAEKHAERQDPTHLLLGDDGPIREHGADEGSSHEVSRGVHGILVGDDLCGLDAGRFHLIHEQPVRVGVCSSPNDLHCDDGHANSCPPYAVGRLAETLCDSQRSNCCRVFFPIPNCA